MYRVKQLFGGSLTLRDYDGQCGGSGHGTYSEQNDEVRYARKCAYRLKTQPALETLALNLIYSTNPHNA